MARRVASARIGSDRALHVIANRVGRRSDELAEQIVRRIRAEILDYQVVDGSDPLFEEAVEFSRQNVDWFVRGLGRSEPLSGEDLERVHEIAARRVHEGVSLESFQHALRIWGEVTWNVVLASARVAQPEEREAALELAGRIWRHVDRLSGAAADGFVNEITDRGLLRRQVLDGLLAGRGDSEWMRRLAKAAHLTLGEHHVVLIVRSAQTPRSETRQHPLAARVALDRIVAVARSRLRPAAGSPLIGVRHGDVVALYPVAGREELARVAGDCHEVASALTVDVSIGMSGWHAGLQAITEAYGEARAAADVGAALGIRDRAVALEDVLVDHLLLSSRHARRLLDDVLRPLTDYDRERRAELVATLRAYLEADANLARSAKALTVHANTVAYRLRRISELSGRDPHDLDDLLVLFLALKLAELSSG